MLLAEGDVIEDPPCPMDCCEDAPFLPNEIWVQVFSHLPPADLIFGASHTCQHWRRVIRTHASRLPMLTAHCSVEVIDIDDSLVYCDGSDIDITYAFTIYDTAASDFRHSLYQCRGGTDTNYAEIIASHGNFSGLLTELFPFKGDSETCRKPRKFDREVAILLMSHMRVSSIRFEVIKEGRRTYARLRDNRFVHALEWIRDNCGHLAVRALTLYSITPKFEWCWSEESVCALASLDGVECISLENMLDLDCHSKRLPFPLAHAKQIRMKFEQHGMARDEAQPLVLLNMDGSFLLSLARAHVRSLVWECYSHSPRAVASITADDIAIFIKAWRGLMVPWQIRCIAFNTLCSISEFRTTATRTGLFHSHFLRDIPYCRFRTFHPSDPNVMLELGCYANGQSTAWTIRSGIQVTKAR